MMVCLFGMMQSLIQGIIIDDIELVGWGGLSSKKRFSWGRISYQRS